MFQPDVEIVEGREGRHDLPQPVARITHILLHLALLPAGGGVAELGLEQEVAGHGRKACVDITFLTPANPIHSGAHVVIDTPARHATEHRKGVVVRVKQHLVGLQQIGAQVERPAVAELEVRHLQLGAHSGNNRPVLTPVKLKGLTWAEGQGHEGATARSLLGHQALLVPKPDEGRDAVVGARVAQGL